MKKVVMIIISLFIAITYNLNVYAKDTFYSLNKYKEEKLNFILEGYNDKQSSNGKVVAGTYLKDTLEIDDREYNDIQVLLMKYNNDGKIVWSYDYGKDVEDNLYYLSYSYGDDNNIDGYILAVKETSEIIENKGTNPIFIKLDLKGKEVYQKNTNLSLNSDIKKIIPTYDSNNNVDGYIVVGSNDNKGFIAKYNKELDQVWIKDNNESTSIEDAVVLRNENVISSYVLISCYDNGQDKSYKLYKYDLNGNVVEVIKDDFENKDNPKLLESNNSFLVYGFTHEVKFKSDKSTAYYIIKFNSNSNEEEWETVGNTPTNDNKTLEIRPVIKQDKIVEYLIMASNDNDSSIEITRLNLDGVLENKIKKINNEYYDIESFYFSKNIIYFIGQISCPEDDNCDYNMKSLYLISTEDKVIEVKEDDNNMILIVSGIIFGFLVTLYIIKKYVSNKQK